MTALNKGAPSPVLLALISLFFTATSLAIAVAPAAFPGESLEPIAMAPANSQVA